MGFVGKIVAMRNVILLCLLAICLSSIANARRVRFCDSQGHPLVAARVYSYVPHTSTPYVLRADKNGILNPNPTITDLDGYANIYFGKRRYDLKLYDFNDVYIREYKNVGKEFAGCSKE
jgi:hypothetical protein